MAISRRGLNTCAGMELVGMNEPTGPVSILRGIAGSRTWFEFDDPDKREMSFGRAFYVMSVAWDRDGFDSYRRRPKKTADRIDRWKKYVEKHDLGTVVIAPDNPNPIHRCDTIVRSAIYTPNLDNLWRHIIETKPVYFRKGERYAW